MGQIRDKITELAQEWSDLVDSYHSTGEIDNELISLLIAIGAIDENTSIKVGQWNYWVREFGKVWEVARSPVYEE